MKPGRKRFGDAGNGRLGRWLALIGLSILGCDERKAESPGVSQGAPDNDGRLAPATPMKPPVHPEGTEDEGEANVQAAAGFHAPDASFLPNTLLWDRFPIDISHLNDGDRPAGSHGRVQVKGDQLVFEDGRVARFWGTNVWGAALFDGNTAAIKRQVARIAAFGFNLVRIHHHDAFWADPNVFERDGTTQKLNDAALQRLDYWICQLKAAGVYVWLDLSVERHFEPGDRVPGFEELTRSETHSKGFSHVNPRIEAMMQDFAARYLRRTNHCSGLTYMDDPALVAVLLTNENDLVSHYGHALSGDQNPYHQELYRKLADAFADNHGLDQEDTYEPWNPEAGRLAMIELEHGLWERGRDHLTKLGLKAPVVATSYWGEGLFAGLVSLAAGDLMDAHAYGSEGFLLKHPAKEPHFLHWIGGAHIEGMPLAATEWNVPWPARDRALAPMWVAAIAALQGWDAPLWYAYQGAPLAPPSEPQQWNGSHDPASMALMPNAAIAFRRGDVKPAKRHFVLELSKDALLADDNTPGTSRALTTLLERSRVTIALPAVPELGWHKATSIASSAKRVRDLGQAFITSKASEIRSDTDEIVRNLRQGIVRIDTPKNQAIMGWLGTDTLKLSTLEIEIKTPMAAIAVTSLDDRPLRTSERMLLSVAAQASAGEKGGSPFVAEPVQGDVRLYTLVHGLELVPLAPDGRALAPRPGKRRGLRTQFSLPEGIATHWYLIQARPERTPEAQALEEQSAEQEAQQAQPPEQPPEGQPHGAQLEGQPVREQPDEEQAPEPQTAEGQAAAESAPQPKTPRPQPTEQPAPQGPPAQPTPPKAQPAKR